MSVMNGKSQKIFIDADGERYRIASPRIGRRTGVDRLGGKKIRVDEYGRDIFDDYFSDSNDESQVSPAFAAKMAAALAEVRLQHARITKTPHKSPGRTSVLQWDNGITTAVSPELPRIVSPANKTPTTSLGHTTNNIGECDIPKLSMEPCVLEVTMKSPVNHNVSRTKIRNLPRTSVDNVVENLCVRDQNSMNVTRTPVRNECTPKKTVERTRLAEPESNVTCRTSDRDNCTPKKSDARMQSNITRSRLSFDASSCETATNTTELAHQRTELLVTRQENSHGDRSVVDERRANVTVGNSVSLNNVRGDNNKTAVNDERVQNANTTGLVSNKSTLSVANHQVSGRGNVSNSTVLSSSVQSTRSTQSTSHRASKQLLAYVDDDDDDDDDAELDFCIIPNVKESLAADSKTSSSGSVVKRDAKLNEISNSKSLSKSSLVAQNGEYSRKSLQSTPMNKASLRKNRNERDTSTTNSAPANQDNDLSCYDMTSDTDGENTTVHAKNTPRTNARVVRNEEQHRSRTVTSSRRDVEEELPTSPHRETDNQCTSDVDDGHSKTDQLPKVSTAKSPRNKDSRSASANLPATAPKIINSNSNHEKSSTQNESHVIQPVSNGRRVARNRPVDDSDVESISVSDRADGASRRKVVQQPSNEEKQRKRAKGQHEENTSRRSDVASKTEQNKNKEICLQNPGNGKKQDPKGSSAAAMCKPAADVKKNNVRPTTKTSGKKKVIRSSKSDDTEREEGSDSDFVEEIQGKETRKKIQRKNLSANLVNGKSAEKQTLSKKTSNVVENGKKASSKQQERPKKTKVRKVPSSSSSEQLTSDGLNSESDRDVVRSGTVKHLRRMTSDNSGNNDVTQAKMTRRPIIESPELAAQIQEENPTKGSLSSVNKKRSKAAVEQDSHLRGAKVVAISDSAAVMERAGESSAEDLDVSLTAISQMPGTSLSIRSASVTNTNKGKPRASSSRVSLSTMKKTRRGIASSSSYKASPDDDISPTTGNLTNVSSLPTAAMPPRSKVTRRESDSTTEVRTSLPVDDRKRKSSGAFVTPRHPRMSIIPRNGQDHIPEEETPESAKVYSRRPPSSSRAANKPRKRRKASPQRSPAAASDTDGNGQYWLELKDSTKIIHQPASDSEDGLRRSSRVRVRPLQYYKCERILYQTRKTDGVFEIAGIIAPNEALVTRKPPHKVKSIKSSRKLADKKPRDKMADLKHLSVHVDDWEEPDTEISDGEIIQYDVQTHEEHAVKCFIKSEDAVFVDPLGSEGSSSGPLAICRMRKQGNVENGEMILRGLCTKERQNVHNSTIWYYVIYGKVEVTIHNTTVVFCTGDHFDVLPGNSYSIRNLRSDDAHLTYTIIRPTS